MGCSGYKSINTNYLDIIESVSKVKKWKYAKKDIKNSITSFLHQNNITDIEVGIYEKNTYFKKEKLQKIQKNCVRKIFLVGNTIIDNINNEKLLNFLKKYFQKNTYYDKYNDCIVNKLYFLPSFILNETFDNLLNIFEKDNLKKTKFCFISFINFDVSSSISINNIIEIKNNVKKEINFEIIAFNQKNIKNIEKYRGNFILSTKVFFDKYKSFSGYTIVIETKIKKAIYWFDNDALTDKVLDSINTMIEEDTIDKSNPASLTEAIQSYISNNSDDKSSFEIYYQYYQIFNHSQVQIKQKMFPIIIKTNKINNDKTNNFFIFFSIKQNVQIEQMIINSIKNALADLQLEILTETFKEKKLSFISAGIITGRKQFIVKILSPISYKNVFILLEFIKNELNPSIKNMNKNYMIKHLVIFPQKESEVSFLQDNKNINCILIRNSKCLNYVYETIIEKYKKLLGNIKVFLFDKVINIDTSLRDKFEFIDIEEEIKMNNEKMLNCFFYNFSKETYNSHLLISLNEEGKVTSSNFFKNSSSIYFTHLFNSKQPFPLISKETFSSIKKTLKEEGNVILSKLNLSNIISTTKIFNHVYEHNIYYQPLLSLKYNKENMKYKNYTLNFVSINPEKDSTENDLNIDLLAKYPIINEISKIFTLNDNYFHLESEYIKCKNCNKILYGKVSNARGIIETDKFNFYLCPITKKIFCFDCEKKNRETYPFNLVYVKCKDKRIVTNISLNSIDNFPNVRDSKDFPEISDNLCDICNESLISIDSSEKYFYLCCNIINRNLPCLICHKCFEFIDNNRRDWILTKEYQYLLSFLSSNFVDQENLIMKRIIVQ